MIKKILFWIILSLIFILAMGSMASMAGEFSLSAENDVMGHTDRHYTHGTRLFYLFDDLSIFSFEGRENRVGIGLSQYMYTPSDIKIAELMEDDRPYGGWLYLSFLLSSRDGNSLDLAAIDIGVVGPSSGAKETQKLVHSWIDCADPKGWDNQIEDEIGLNLIYQRKYKWSKKGLIDFDFITYGGGSLGNVFTYCDVGGMLRIGHNIPDDFGYIKMEPSSRVTGVSAYLFLSAEGRYVLRNIFLDGNTFKDSHSVDKEDVVGDAVAGLGFEFGKFELIYGYNHRTKEFKGQDEHNRYGTLILNWKY